MSNVLKLLVACHLLCLAHLVYSCLNFRQPKSYDLYIGPPKDADCKSCMKGKKDVTGKLNKMAPGKGKKGQGKRKAKGKGKKRRRKGRKPKRKYGGKALPSKIIKKVKDVKRRKGKRITTETKKTVVKASKQKMMQQSGRAGGGGGRGGSTSEDKANSDYEQAAANGAAEKLHPKQGRRSYAKRRKVSAMKGKSDDYSSRQKLDATENYYVEGYSMDKGSTGTRRAGIPAAYASRSAATNTFKPRSKKPRRKRRAKKASKHRRLERKSRIEKPKGMTAAEKEEWVRRQRRLGNKIPLFAAARATGGGKKGRVKVPHIT